jgi:hypothetical protein
MTLCPIIINNVMNFRMGTAAMGANKFSTTFDVQIDILLFNDEALFLVLKYIAGYIKQI